MTLAIIIATSAINKLPNVSSVGGLIGVSVSASFLFLLGESLCGWSGCESRELELIYWSDCCSRHQLGNAVAVSPRRPQAGESASRFPLLRRCVKHREGLRLKRSTRRNEIRQLSKPNQPTPSQPYPLSLLPAYLLLPSLRQSQPTRRSITKLLKYRTSS